MKHELDVPVVGSDDKFVRLSVWKHEGSKWASMHVNLIEVEKHVIAGGVTWVGVKQRLMGGVMDKVEPMARRNDRRLEGILAELKSHVKAKAGKGWDAVRKVCAEYKVEVGDLADTAA